MTRSTLALAAVLAVARLAAAPLVVVKAPSQGPIAFGAGDLKAALASQGYELAPADARDAFEVVAGTVGADYVPPGAPVPAKPESFAIVPDLANRQVFIVGRDETGAMYGCFELAERLKLGTPLEQTQPVTQSPFLEFRAPNPFLSLPYPFTGKYDDWWFLSEDFWRTWLDMLARARFNWVDLHGMYEIKSTFFPNIYPYFVNSKTFPVAGIDDAQKARNLAMLNRIIALAKERGISLALMSYHASWNGPGTVQAPYQETEENLALYNRECVAELLRQCPDLGMIGFRIGESGRSEGFYGKSYLPGLADYGKPKPLYTRTWLASKDKVMDLGRAYPGKFIIEIKYNGEHFGLPYIVSGGRMRQWASYSYQDYCRPPRAYKIVWQNRANGTHRLFRWGNPEWAARAARSYALDCGVGFCVEIPNGYEPFQDTYHRNPDLKWLKWVVERDWLFYEMLGRASYNPDLTEAPWLLALGERFGKDAAAPVLAASRSMSMVVPLIFASHCLGPDSRNMAPEFETGGSISEFAGVQPFDTFAIQPIKEYARGLVSGRRSARTDPFQIAELLQGSGRDAAVAITDAARKATASKAELADWQADVTCLGYLADYYAEKMRAATYLELWRVTHDNAQWGQAKAHMKAAVDGWRRLSEYGDRQYLPLVDTLRMGDKFQWKNLLPQVQADLGLLDKEKADFERDAGDVITVTGIRPASLRPLGLTVTCEPLTSKPERKSFRVRVVVTGGATADMRATLKIKLMPSEAQWKPRPLALKDGVFEGELDVTPVGAQWAVEVVGKDCGACWPDWRTETPYRIVEAWDGPVTPTVAGRLPDLGRNDFSRARCGAILLGRVAATFNAAPPDQKQALLAQVAAGQTLVVFNQDYPGFDSSWLPGGIQGTDADFDACKTLGPHPLLQ